MNKLNVLLTKLNQALKGINFPICAQSGNSIINNLGMVSYCYELETDDFEQRDGGSISQFYNEVRQLLVKLDIKYFYKFWHTNNRVFINTNDKDFKFGKYKLTPIHRPMDLFFNNSKIGSNCIEGKDYLKINHEYISLITFNNILNQDNEHGGIPTECLGWADEYHVIFKGRSMAVKKKLLENTEFLNSTTELKDPNNPDAKRANQDIGTIREQLHSGSASFHNMLTVVVLRDNSLEKLDKKRKRYLEFLENDTQFECEVETDSIAKLYLEILFGTTPYLNYKSYEVTNSVLSNYLPLSVDYIHESGLKFVSNKDNDIFFNFLAKSKTNHNMIFSGPTGSGKTVASFTFLEKYLEDGKHGLILEYGNSADKFTKWNMGTDFSDGLPLFMYPDATYLTDVITSIIPDNEFSYKERAALRLLIFDYLEENKDSYSPEDLLEHLKTDSRVVYTFLAEFLENITFDSHSSLRNLGKLVRVDIANYPKRLQRAVLVFCLKWFDELADGYLHLDELSTWIKQGSSNDDGDFISHFFRNKRKTGQLVAAMTQSPYDGNVIPYFDVMMENADTKLIFDLKKRVPQSDIIFSKFEARKINQVSSAGMSDIGSIKHRNRTEKRHATNFTLISESERIVKNVWLYLSPLQFERFHSDPIEKKLFNQYEFKNKDYFPDFKSLLKSYATLRRGESVE